MSLFHHISRLNVFFVKFIFGITGLEFSQIKNKSHAKGKHNEVYFISLHLTNYKWNWFWCVIFPKFKKKNTKPTLRSQAQYTEFCKLLILGALPWFTCKKNPKKTDEHQSSMALKGEMRSRRSPSCAWAHVLPVVFTSVWNANENPCGLISCDPNPLSTRAGRQFICFSSSLATPKPKKRYCLSNHLTIQFGKVIWNVFLWIFLLDAPKCHASL